MAGVLSLPVSGVITGVQEQNYINSAIAALAAMSQGSSAPTTTSTGLTSTAGVWWHNTSNGNIYVRNQADNAWILIGTLTETGTGGTFAPAGVTFNSAAIISALGYTPIASTTCGALAGVTAVSAAVTLSSSSNNTLVNCGGTGSYTVTLPSVPSVGTTIEFACLTAANSVTLAGNINGNAATSILWSDSTSGAAARFVSNGSTWLQVLLIITSSGSGSVGGGG